MGFGHEKRIRCNTQWESIPMPTPTRMGTGNERIANIGFRRRLKPRLSHTVLLRPPLCLHSSGARDADFPRIWSGAGSSMTA